MHRCMTMWHGFTADYHDQVCDFFLLYHMTQKSTFWVQKLWKFYYFFNFKILYCNYLPFRSPFMTLYYSSSLSWVDMHWSHESEDIYNFQLAIQVNTNNIGDFFRTKLCPLRDPMRALIGFGRCQIPSSDGLSCSAPIFTHAILLHQLWANSWKYMCLRTMECLHHVTVMWKVLKGLSISSSSSTCFAIKWVVIVNIPWYCTW